MCKLSVAAALFAFGSLAACAIPPKFPDQTKVELHHVIESIQCDLKKAFDANKDFLDHGSGWTAVIDLELQIIDDETAAAGGIAVIHSPLSAFAKLRRKSQVSRTASFRFSHKMGELDEPCDPNKYEGASRPILKNRLGVSGWVSRVGGAIRRGNNYRIDFDEFKVKGLITYSVEFVIVQKAYAGVIVSLLPIESDTTGIGAKIAFDRGEGHFLTITMGLDAGARKPDFQDVANQIKSRNFIRNR